VREGKAEEVVSWVLDEQEQPQREPMQMLEDICIPPLPALAS